MTIELVFLLIVLWFLFGLIDAWVLHRLGDFNWRWTMICVLTGPLSVSVLYDQRYLAEPKAEAAVTDEPPTPARCEDVDEVSESSPDGASDWPDDDPESRLMLHGYRGLADH